MSIVLPPALRACIVSRRRDRLQLQCKSSASVSAETVELVMAALARARTADGAGDQKACGEAPRRSAAGDRALDRWPGALPTPTLLSGLAGRGRLMPPRLTAAG